MLRAVGGGIAAPPVEGDAPDPEPGRQASATDVEVSVHVQRHWGAGQTEDIKEGDRGEEEAERGAGNSGVVAVGKDEGKRGGGGSEGEERKIIRTREEG